MGEDGCRSGGDEVVCRCEEVTADAVARAIADGADTLHEVKRLTRAGMGPCQGRTCRPLVAELLAQKTGRKVTALAPPTQRPPLRPVRLGDLVRAGVEPGREDTLTLLKIGRDR